jgi:hypothetical protein
MRDVGEYANCAQRRLGDAQPQGKRAALAGFNYALATQTSGICGFIRPVPGAVVPRQYILQMRDSRRMHAGDREAGKKCQDPRLDIATHE